MKSGDERSVRRVAQAPPATLRWNRTDSDARSGSTVARTVTGSTLLTVPPSAGEVIAIVGAGTLAERLALLRVCPALSSTTAR